MTAPLAPDLAALAAVDRYPTPGDVAMHALQGWKPYPWLVHLNAAITHTLATPGACLVVEAPVRHGKSMLTTEAGIAYSLLRWPADPVLLGCHTAQLANKFGRSVRRIVRRIGPELGIRIDPESSAQARFGLVGYDLGGFLALPVGASPTGHGAKRMFIDDPIKAMKQVETKEQRDDIWEWFSGTMRTRLHAGGSIVVVMARWHPDDIIGRIFDPAYGTGDDWTRFTVPAIARENDPVGRAPGEPLCPELGYTKAELARIKRSVPTRVWGANYDQNPTQSAGTLFDPSMWRTTRIVPAGSTMVRWWDNAATRNAGAYTASVLLALTPQRRWVVVDVWRAQVSSAERRAKQRELAIADNARWGRTAAGGRVTSGAEQEPGSGGKEQAELFREETMMGLPAVTEGTSGVSKEVRAETWAAQQTAGRVAILLNSDGSMPTWAADYLEEHKDFPLSTYKDQVDASAHAHNWAALKAPRGKSSNEIQGQASGAIRTGNAGLGGSSGGPRARR